MFVLAYIIFLSYYKSVFVEFISLEIMANATFATTSFVTGQREYDEGTRGHGHEARHVLVGARRKKMLKLKAARKHGKCL